MTPWTRRVPLLAAALAACAHAPVAPAPAPEPPDRFHDLLMTPDDCTRPPRATVTRAQVQSDLAVLARVLRDGYAGYEVLARAGLDWDRVLRELRQDLDAREEPIAVEGLAARLAAALAPAGDNHLAFFAFSPAGWTGYRSTGRKAVAWAADLVLEPRRDGWFVRSGPVPAGMLLVDCANGRDRDLVRRSVDDDLAPAGLPVELSETPPEPLRCRFLGRRDEVVEASLPMHRVAVGPAEPAGRPAFERLADGGVTRLRVRTFDERSDALLRAFVETALEARGRPATVVDLRGNRGGSDRYVADWFANLTTGELRYPVIVELRSDVTWQGAANRATCGAAGLAPDDPGRARLLAARDDALAALDDASERVRRPFKEWVRTRPYQVGQAPAPYGGVLVVLVDAGCASACETFVMYARQVPGTVVVGENTAGVGTFGEVRTYRLPATGLGVAAGSKWFHDPDPARVAIEGVGHAPDLFVDDADAAGIAVRLAACLAAGDCRDVHVR